MSKLLKEFTAGRGYSKRDWDEVADVPEITEEQAAQRMTFEEAVRRFRGKGRKAPKQVVTLRLDPDVVEAFKADGPGWQSRVNAALREAKNLPERA